MRVKMSKQPPSAPNTSAVGPCPTVIQIVGRPRTGSLPSAIAICLGRYLHSEAHFVVSNLYCQNKFSKSKRKYMLYKKYANRISPWVSVHA